MRGIRHDLRKRRIEYVEDDAPLPQVAETREEVAIDLRRLARLVKRLEERGLV